MRKSFNVAGSLDAEPRHVGAGAEAGDFFFEGHQGDDVIHALFDRQVGILEGVLVGAVGRTGAGDQEKQEDGGWWNWLSFWCSVENKGPNWVRFVMRFWAGDAREAVFFGFLQHNVTSGPKPRCHAPFWAD